MQTNKKTGIKLLRKGNVHYRFPRQRLTHIILLFIAFVAAKEEHSFTAALIFYVYEVNSKVEKCLDFIERAANIITNYTFVREQQKN